MGVVAAFDKLDDSNDVKEVSQRIDSKLERVIKTNRSRSIKEAFGGNLKAGKQLKENSNNTGSRIDSKVNRMQQLAGMRDPYNTK